MDKVKYSHAPGPKLYECCRMVADVSELIRWESGVMPDPRVLVTISHAEAGNARRRAIVAL